MGVKAAMGKPSSDYAMFLFLAFWSAMVMGCGERENLLVIEKPTEVYAITQAASAPDPSTNIQPGNVIARLQAGETANVVAVYHGQPHDGFKVKLADGTEGLILAGDTFQVRSR